ncbi:MAG: serine/threonine protein kinase [Burkholderiales bacterium]|nr:serine/threonine protein kinase [Burkholderiales bacterium]MDE1926756.1 serine/threonine protein kinase [Burkholderiales bacterium]MDE2160505.1 serine/threonine protein kinase [Burkholderiales bacterium]MDE2502477.1 serine/threonine protein kinase [Burkholderiales bacterium]
MSASDRSQAQLPEPVEGEGLPARAHIGIGSVVGGYRLLRPLGAGEHGAVFLAAAADGWVALKLVPLPPDRAHPARAAFLHGAEVARGLVHPGIVGLAAAGIEGEVGWLALEPVPGGDLLRYTRASRLLPVPVVLRLGERVAQALAYAHERGVVHRDIKPANVLVDWATDLVKVADFGLARSTTSPRTETGVVLGSPAYMAPELLAGEAPTPASDLYALGAMLFQLLSASLPHEGATMGELLRRVAQSAAPDLASLRPELPPRLSALVAAMLAKRTAERPAQARQIAQDLAALRAAMADPA